MLLAELEVYHSRPIAPTRRVALGALTLPCEPAPGAGGILLGAVAARFTPELDPDLTADLVSLTRQVEAGQRIPQPRLRYRLQDDRVGLTRSTHRLFRHDDDGDLNVTFTSDKGLPGQMVLGAIYAASTIPGRSRGRVLAAIRRGIAWRNDIGPALLINLSGTGAAVLHADALADPVGWALRTLGLNSLGTLPKRAVVQSCFRQSLIDVHPDHGGDHNDAARRIADITEARRILLAS